MTNENTFNASRRASENKITAMQINSIHRQSNTGDVYRACASVCVKMGERVAQRQSVYCNSIGRTRSLLAPPSIVRQLLNYFMPVNSILSHRNETPIMNV